MKEQWNDNYCTWGRMMVQEDARVCADRVTVDVIDEIVPLVHIGRVPVHSLDMDYLKGRGFGAILDLCLDSPLEGDMAKGRGISYHGEYVVDGTSPTEAQFVRVTEWMKEQALKKKKIYVHCHAGLGRAPTVVIAYLILAGLPLFTAVGLVRKNRKSRQLEISMHQVDGITEFAQHVARSRERVA